MPAPRSPRPRKARWRACGRTIWRRRWCARWSSAPGRSCRHRGSHPRLRLPGGRAGLQRRPPARCCWRICRFRVAGTTVNRFCGSSMQSVHIAAGQIAARRRRGVHLCRRGEHEPRADARLQPDAQPGAAQEERRRLHGHGRHRGERRAPVADHARRAGGIRRAQPRSAPPRRRRPGSSPTRSCRSPARPAKSLPMAASAPTRRPKRWPR